MNECIVNFYIPGKTKPVWHTILSYEPHFHVGEIVQIDEAIMEGHEHIWNDGVTVNGSFVISKISHVFETRYGATAGGVQTLYFLNVTVEESKW